jgi:pyruvate dehydrogenase E2 component (dihydrolipoamide acetyltransferase)
VKASPIARRIASENDLDLQALEGSGPGGRIVKADVEKAVKDGPPAKEKAPAGRAPSGDAEKAKGEVEVQDLSKLQTAVARRMAESKATAPHFYLNAEIDMTRAVEARARLKESSTEGEVLPSYNDMIVKACAIALREFPRANAAYRDGRFELYSRVNVGVAVAAQDSLVVPTVFDADAKGLRQIAEEVRGLAGKVREGKIKPPELSGGTFTVSNLGMYGIDSFSAVINPPQAAILAVGAINEKPVIRDGEVATAHLMAVNLACDHRILYGADGAEFLSRIRALLEEPLSLAL